MFKGNYKIDNRNIKATAYGFNMNSLDITINHLRGIMPKLVLYSNNITGDDSRINSYTGLMTLFNSDLKDINIDKKMVNIRERNYYAFIISRRMFHEIFGHKKSLISIFGNETISPITFKYEGNIKFITEDNDDNQFSNLIDILDEGINIDSCFGDSGYLLEFYFGEKNNIYITSIIDYIIKKSSNTDLGDLLDTKLWHEKNEIFKDYAYYIFLASGFNINVNQDLALEEKIKYLKEEIEKIKSKEEEEKESKNKYNNNQSKTNQIYKGKKNTLLLNNNFLKENLLLKKNQKKKEKKISSSFYPKRVYRK